MPNDDRLYSRSSFFCPLEVPLSGRRTRRMAAVWVAIAGLVGALGVAVIGVGVPATPRLMAALSRLGARLDTQLTDDQVAGTWVDQQAGKLVLATTAPAQDKGVRSRLAGLSDVEVRQVARSGRDLASLKDKVGAAVAGHRLRNTSWYVDVQKNTVDVEIGDGNPDTDVKAFTDDIKPLGPGVTVKRVHGAVRQMSGSTPLWNGSGINTVSGQCSAGFGARNSEGKDFVLTAGHCVESNDVWYHQGLVIGGRGTYDSDAHDWGVIHVISVSAVYPTNLINTYDGHPLKLTGQGGYAVGSKVCKSGERTGYTCGTIDSVNADVTTSRGRHRLGFIRVTGLCSLPGDSGGPLVMPNGDGTASAVGIDSSAGSPVSRDEKCPHDVGQSDDRNVSYFEPIERALSESNLSLRLD